MRKSIDRVNGNSAKCAAVIDLLEKNRTYVSVNPKCEPRLGKRGLYRRLSGRDDLRQHEMALLRVLNLWDGGHSLLDIAERAGLSFDVIHTAAEALAECGLCQERNEGA